MGKFVDYAAAVAAIQDAKVMVSAATSRLAESAELVEADVNPAFAMHVTQHAATRAVSRLNECAVTEPKIMCDLVNQEHPERSLAIIENMHTFLITVLAHAFESGSYVEVPSRNNKGKSEYKYTTPVVKWIFKNKRLDICAHVEDNAVKTVYFDWKVENGSVRGISA